MALKFKGGFSPVTGAMKVGNAGPAAPDQPPVTTGLVSQWTAKSLNLTEGAAVSVWPDNYGSHDATSGSAVYEVTSNGGLPAVRGSVGVTHSTDFDHAGENTIFTVYSTDVSTNSSGGFQQIGFTKSNWSGNGPTPYQLYQFNDQAYGYAGNNNSNRGTAIYSLGEIHSNNKHFQILNSTLTYSGGNSTLTFRKNGYGWGAGTQPGITGNVTNNGGFGTPAGAISEVLVYNVALSNAEIIQVEEYLSEQWNIGVNSNPVTNLYNHGLVVHHDATTVTGTDTQPITSWDNLTNETWLTSVSGALDSVYNASGKNGLPTVTMPYPSNIFYDDGSASVATHQGSYTVFTVFKKLSYTQYHNVIAKVDWATGNNTIQYHHAGLTDTNSYSHSGSVYNTAYDSVNTWPTVGQWAIVEVTVNWNGSTTNVSHSINNSSYQTGSVAGKTGNSLNYMQLMLTDGEYAEQLIFSNNLSTAERSDVRNYLNNKWAIY